VNTNEPSRSIKPGNSLTSNCSSVQEIPCAVELVLFRTCTKVKPVLHRHKGHILKANFAFSHLQQCNVLSDAILKLTEPEIVYLLWWLIISGTRVFHFEWTMETNNHDKLWSLFEWAYRYTSE